MRTFDFYDGDCPDDNPTDPEIILPSWELDPTRPALGIDDADFDERFYGP